MRSGLCCVVACSQIARVRGSMFLFGTRPAIQRHRVLDRSNPVEGSGVLHDAAVPPID
jgi:hypothetical protein